MADAMAEDLAAGGLTRARATLMTQSHRLGPANQRALADALRVTSRNITGLVDGLVEAGPVARSRHPDDRRATLVSLTDAGARAGRRTCRGRTGAGPVPSPATTRVASRVDEPGEGGVGHGGSELGHLVAEVGFSGGVLEQQPEPAGPGRRRRRARGGCRRRSPRGRTRWRVGCRRGRGDREGPRGGGRGLQPISGPEAWS